MECWTLAISCSLQFHEQTQDRRRQSDPKIPFEYCYDMRLHTLSHPYLSFSFYAPYLKRDLYGVQS